MKSVETKSFFRKDESGRLVEVIFIKNNGELSAIKVYTFFADGTKLKSCYTKEDEEFETVRKRELKYLSDIVAWIIVEKPREAAASNCSRLEYTASLLKG